MYFLIKYISGRAVSVDPTSFGNIESAQSALSLYSIKDGEYYLIAEAKIKCQPRVIVGFETI